MITFFTVLFDYEDQDPIYSAMHANLKYTIEKFMPDAKLVTKVIRKTPVRYGVKNIAKNFDRGLVSNSIKLNQWVKFAIRHKNDENPKRIVFIDCDTLLLGDISEVFYTKFDICYTKRSIRFPMNGGVIFLKTTTNTIEFLKLWRKNNDYFMNNPRQHQAWMVHWGGVNQAAFGKTLDKYSKELDIKTVPGDIYNACDLIDWYNVSAEKTKIIHIKSELRTEIFGKIKRRNPLLDKAKNLYLQNSI